MNWKALLGILFSAILLFLAFRKVDVGELRAALGSADYVYIVPAMMLCLVSLWFRAVRWRYLLMPVKRIRLNSLVSSTSIGIMSNYVLPARLGEFVRAYAVGRKEGISKSAALATILFERIVDGLTLLFFLVVTLLFFSIRFPGWLKSSVIVTALLYAIALSFVVFLRLRTASALRFARVILRRFPERAAGRIIVLLESFVEGLGIIQSGRDMAIAALLSLCIWLPNVALIQIVFASLGMGLSIWISFFLLVSLGIGVMIPSAPGFVGTIQFVTVVVLALFGVREDLALTVSILYHASIFIPIVAAGTVYCVIEGLSFGEIRRSVGGPKSVGRGARGRKDSSDPPPARSVERER